MKDYGKKIKRKRIYHNNEKYIGNFVNDLKEGNGIFYYLDG